MNKMNRLIIAFTAVLALLCSCSKEQPAAQSASEPEVTVIEAWQESNGTKALYDGTSIQWEAGDAISVFPSGSSSSVKFSKESGDNNFFAAEGNVNLNGIYALYPYSASAAISSGKITTVIKTTQTATPGSFAPDANLAVGYSADGKSVYFKNVVSYVKVSYRTTFSSAQITKITFTPLDGKTISGNVTIVPTVTDGRVTAVAAQVKSSALLGGRNYVELTGDIQPNTDYYLVVAPVNLSQGYRLTFTDANGRQFTRTYSEAKNKVSLLRNAVSATGVKNIDNYTTSFSAYWRVKSADEFTCNNDKYLLVKNTSASSTGYRVFDEGKTDVFISTGQPLVDKFAGGTITGLSSKLSSWKTGGSAPLFMSHYVLYCFRSAYSDNGLQFDSNSAEFIQNPSDAYAFTVSNEGSAQGNTANFSLCYKYSGAKSTDVTLTQCYLEAKGGNTFKLWGHITQDSIDGLVDVFFLNKGTQFKAAVSPADIHSGADRSVNALTQIGFCSTEVTTVDQLTTMNNCFMIKNYYLCNYPDPEAILIYKKASRQLTLDEYYRLFSNF